MTPLELSFYRDEAQRLQLKGWQILYQYTLDELSKICNGIGAKWMEWISVRGRTICDLINRDFPEFIPSSMIHDIKYYLGGSAAEREAADDQFYDNCMNSIDSENKRERELKSAALAMHFALRVFGHSAWGKHDEQ